MSRNELPITKYKFNFIADRIGTRGLHDEKEQRRKVNFGFTFPLFIGLNLTAICPQIGENFMLAFLF